MNSIKFPPSFRHPAMVHESPGHPVVGKAVDIQRRRLHLVQDGDVRSAEPSLPPVYGSALRCQSCEVGIQLPPRVFQTVDEGGDGRSVWKTGYLGKRHQGEVASQRCLCQMAPKSRIRWPRLNEELLRPGSARRAGRGPGSFPVAPWLDLQKARGILPVKRRVGHHTIHNCSNTH